MRFAGVMAFAAACGGGAAPGVDAPSPDAPFAFQPTAPAVLSTGSPAEDEDPSVLRAPDGALWVAWMGRRNGNADIYVSSTRDGATWTTPARVTTDADDDFYPTLLYDAAPDGDGAFHLVWYRHQPALPYYSHVRHTRSADGVAWDVADERQVAPPPGGTDIEDWVPTIARAPGGPLRVYFVSKLRAPPRHHVFVATATDARGDAWGAPAALPELTDAAANDHLPVVLRDGARLRIAWVRHDDSNPPWLNGSSDVMLSSSADGLAWDAPVAVTHDDASNVTDVFPAPYLRSDGAPAIVWASTAASAGTVFDLAIADAAGYPTGRRELPLPGYSPRVVATSTPGVYLGVWVAGATGQQDVWYRFFTP